MERSPGMKCCRLEECRGKKCDQEGWGGWLNGIVVGDGDMVCGWEMQMTGVLGAQWEWVVLECGLAGRWNGEHFSMRLDIDQWLSMGGGQILTPE